MSAPEQCGPNPKTVNTADDYRAYDSLPKYLRKIVREFPYDISSQTVRTLCRKHGNRRTAEHLEGAAADIIAGLADDHG